MSASAETSRVALFRYLPLAVPWVALGDWPTPLDELRIDGKPIWIKREGDSNPDYGGNKVRTLEAWLGHVRAAGAERIWAIGAYGSNHAIATAIHARTAGLSSGAIVFPQPASEWAIENAGALIAAGIPIVRLRNVVEVPFAGVAVAARDRLFAGDHTASSEDRSSSSDWLSSSNHSSSSNASSDDRSSPSDGSSSTGASSDDRSSPSDGSSSTGASSDDRSSPSDGSSSGGASSPSDASSDDASSSSNHSSSSDASSDDRSSPSDGSSSGGASSPSDATSLDARARLFTREAGNRWLSGDTRDRVRSIFAPHLPRRDDLAGDAAGSRADGGSRRLMTSAQLVTAGRNLIARLFGADQAKRSIVMPPGGATPIGTLGALSAAFELAEQVAAGRAPPPRRIVVPVGSTCTTAGLLSGLALAQAVGVWPWPLPIVHAVRVTPWPVTSRVMITQLAAYTLARVAQLGGPRVELDSSRLVVDRRELGRGYGRITPRAHAAMATFADAEAGGTSTRLDGVYSAKAAAALLRLHREGEGPLLFWSTKSTTRLEPPSEIEIARAPRALARWMTR